MPRTTSAPAWGEIFSITAILILATFAWDTLAVYPLKILVVLFHELSHGLAALLTGGRILSISLSPEEGGVCVTQGGDRFLILSAGYLGSLLWGGAILLLASRTRLQAEAITALATLLLVVTILYIRPIASFGFAFGLAASLCLLPIGFWLPPAASAFILRVIGVTSCLYVLLDIKSDILSGSDPHGISDASALAALTGIPAVLWGLLWITLALAAIITFLLLACRTRPPETPAPNARSKPRAPKTAPGK